jgi:hypothetical protein
MNPSTPVTAIKDLRKNPDGSLSYTVEGSSVVYRAEDGVPGTPGSNVHAAILLAYELAEMRRQHEEHEASKLKAAEPAAPPIPTPEVTIDTPAKPSWFRRFLAAAIAAVKQKVPFTRASAPKPVTLDVFQMRALERAKAEKANAPASPAQPLQSPSANAPVPAPVPQAAKAPAPAQDERARQMQADARARAERVAEAKEPKKEGFFKRMASNVRRMLGGRSGSMLNDPPLLDRMAGRLEADRAGKSPDVGIPPLLDPAAPTAVEPPVKSATPTVAQDLLFKSISSTPEGYKVVFGDGYEMAVPKDSKEAPAFARAFTQVTLLTQLYQQMSVDLTSQIAEQHRKTEQLVQKPTPQEGQIVRMPPGPNGISRYGVEMPNNQWHALNLSPGELKLLDAQKKPGKAMILASSSAPVVLDQLQVSDSQGFVPVSQLIAESVVIEAYLANKPKKSSGKKATPEKSPSKDVPTSPAETSVQSENAPPVHKDAPSVESSASPVTPISAEAPSRTEPSAPEETQVQEAAAAKVEPAAPESSAPEITAETHAEVPTAVEEPGVSFEDLPKAPNEASTEQAAAEPPAVDNTERGVLVAVLPESDGWAKGCARMSIGLESGLYDVSLSAKEQAAVTEFFAKNAADPAHPSEVAVERGLDTCTLKGFYSPTNPAAMTPAIEVIGAELTAAPSHNETLAQEWIKRQGAAKAGLAQSAFGDYVSADKPAEMSMV